MAGRGSSVTFPLEPSELTELAVTLREEKVSFKELWLVSQLDSEAPAQQVW